MLPRWNSLLLGKDLWKICFNFQKKTKKEKKARKKKVKKKDLNFVFTTFSLFSISLWYSTGFSEILAGMNDTDWDFSDEGGPRNELVELMITIRLQYITLDSILREFIICYDHSLYKILSHACFLCLIAWCMWKFVQRRLLFESINIETIVMDAWQWENLLPDWIHWYTDQSKSSSNVSG